MSEETSYNQMNTLIQTELKRVFNPEFLNRLDETITFHPLSQSHISHIIDLMIDDVNTQLHKKNMVLQLSGEAKDWLIQKGYDPVYGARPLRRLIQRYIEDPLAEDVLKGHLGMNSRIEVLIEDDTPVFVDVSSCVLPEKKHVEVTLRS